MNRKTIPYILLLVTLLWHTVMFAQERFPRPEFESGYVYPEAQLPLRRAAAWEYVDLTVLIAALSVTTWLAIWKRSRQGLIWMAVFSMAYFGFYREGCICSVGSVQNVSLALFNTDYSIPLTALLFFLIPLVFALFFGRVFCAGVCPLGAIQELTGIKPLRLPRTLEAIMTSIPFVYLAMAVLFSAMKSEFIICRYDPFIGIYRMDAPYTMIIFGVLLLLAGIFLNRPYCRYLCPYGVLLGLFSRFANRHLTITPAECTNCRLCEEDACPYDAIIPSNIEQASENPTKTRRRFLVYFLLIPLFAAAGGILFHTMAPGLARIHRDVRLAREIRIEQETGVEAVSKAAVAFRETGETNEQLFAREMEIIMRFRKSAPWAGIFLGLSLGIGLVSMTLVRTRTEYKPHQGKCYSCGRCFRYCPVEVKKKIQ